jgi:hypothetical protein
VVPLPVSGYAIQSRHAFHIYLDVSRCLFILPPLITLGPDSGPVGELFGFFEFESRRM